MTMLHLNDAFGKLFWGNLGVAVCCGFYLIWWAVAFKPAGGAPEMLSVVLFILAAASGITGVVLAVKGIQGVVVSRTLFPKWSLPLGGVIAYIVLFLVTSFFLKRPVTTELLLIVGWTVFALATVGALYGAGKLDWTPSMVWCVAAVGVGIISMVCYMVYYQLEPVTGYYDGMIPLVLCGLYMAGLCVKMVH